jgi:hypothetical protein
MAYPCRTRAASVLWNLIANCAVQQTNWTDLREAHAVQISVTGVVKPTSYLTCTLYEPSLSGTCVDLSGTFDGRKPTTGECNPSEDVRLTACCLEQRGDGCCRLVR